MSVTQKGLQVMVLQPFSFLCLTFVSDDAILYAGTVNGQTFTAIARLDRDVRADYLYIGNSVT